MIKYLLAVLITVLIVFGAYFIISGKKVSLPTAPSQNQPVTQITPTSSDTSDSALDSDLTALEKDLAELDQSNTDLNEALKGL